jgi:hypothetical protein
MDGSATHRGDVGGSQAGRRTTHAHAHAPRMHDGAMEVKQKRAGGVDGWVILIPSPIALAWGISAQAGDRAATHQRRRTQHNKTIPPLSFHSALGY